MSIQQININLQNEVQHHTKWHNSLNKRIYLGQELGAHLYSHISPHHKSS